MSRSAIEDASAHHVSATGTNHRIQICTTLTALCVEPPAIDVWAFGLHDGRIVEVPANAPG